MIGQLKKIIISICMLATTISTNAQGSGWNVNPYDYPYDMTVYGQLVIDDITVADYSNFEIGAFVGAECRGLAEANNKDNYSWLYFRIRSNTTSGEKVEFKVYNKSDNTIRKIEQSIIFESETTNGLPSNPFTFTLAPQLFTITAKSSEESMGTVSLSHSGEVELGTNIEAKATTTCEGYFFINWTDANGNVVSTDNPFTFTLSSDIELTANFKANEYPVTFEDFYGSKTTTMMAYGSQIPKPDDPKITGYTFQNWLPDDFENGDVYVKIGGNEYKPHFVINQYTLTFDTDGGSAIEPITQDFGTEIKAPSEPTRTGYTFAGWDKDIPANMPSENITFKAIWNINQYTLSFDINGGDSTPIADITANYNSSIEKPTSPTRSGYTFNGWLPEVPVNMPAEDMTCVAQWTINQYTLTFDTDGGSAIEPITQDFGTEIKAPSEPTKTGYTFAGWDKDIPANMPAENITFKAKWNINQYNVKFIVNGETVSEETLEYGAEIITPEAPEIEGYTFTGWSPEVSATVPANDVSYEALYVVNTYKVTYYINDVVVKIDYVNFGEEIPVYEPTIEDNMKFDGWIENIPSVMPAKDIEIHGTTSIIDTSIDNIVANYGDSFIIYDLSGKAIKKLNNKSDISNVPSGIYIVNGMKIYIRNH